MYIYIHTHAGIVVSEEDPRLRINIYTYTCAQGLLLVKNIRDSESILINFDVGNVYLARDIR